MHPSLLLDPLFWEHVVAPQLQLHESRASAARKCRRGGWWRLSGRGDTDADGGGGGLGVESEAAYTPEKLRAA